MAKKSHKSHSTLVPERLKRLGMHSAEIATLKELRKATDHTQEELALALGVGQGTISRLEKRHDMLLSTLQDYVESVGGNLEVVATFPNRSPLLIDCLVKKAAQQAVVPANGTFDHKQDKRGATL